MAVIPVMTDSDVKHAKPREKLYKLTDGQGLYLLITPKGQRWWRFRYRFAGKENCLSFGVYPDVSLREAREYREQARVLLADGLDPSEHKKTVKAAQRVEQARQLAETRFELDSDGALSFRLGTRRLILTPAETGELRAFLDATRAVTPKKCHVAE